MLATDLDADGAALEAAVARLKRQLNDLTSGTPEHAQAQTRVAMHESLLAGFWTYREQWMNFLSLRTVVRRRYQPQPNGEIPALRAQEAEALRKMEEAPDYARAYWKNVAEDFWKQHDYHVVMWGLMTKLIDDMAANSYVVDRMARKEFPNDVLRHAAIVSGDALKVYTIKQFKDTLNELIFE